MLASARSHAPVVMENVNDEGDFFDNVLRNVKRHCLVEHWTRRNNDNNNNNYYYYYYYDDDDDDHTTTTTARTS